jgi:hypothetical protein
MRDGSSHLQEHVGLVGARGAARPDPDPDAEGDVAYEGRGSPQARDRERTSVVAGFGTLSRTLRTRWFQRALVAGRGEDFTERCPQPELCCAIQCVPVDAVSHGLAAEGVSVERTIRRLIVGI